MSKTISYRPEIDGLRTIAVLAVIFYHANFHIFDQHLINGGFLGVDIFFVISGYLITSILITGFQNGNLTLLNFYERRARRILPILLLVITASIPLSWMLLLPSDFQQYSWQILSSIFSISNFYFWTEDSYWAVDSILKPFLHTWSLGIEEQFYLFIPILVLVAIKQKLKKLRYAFIFLALLSLIASHFMSIKDAQSSFYLLPYRAWELLVGAIIATIRKDNFSNFKFSFMPTVGMAIILSCFYLFDKNTLHPSFYSLFPVIGVGLIILFANIKDPITRLLQNKIMTAAGLISYGLYLWHFPVFSYISHAQLFQNVWVKLGAIGLVFLLATSTYFFIEKPFRSFSSIKSKVFWSVLVIWILVLSSFAYWGTKYGLSSRFPELVNIPSKPEKIENHKWFSNQINLNNRVILVGDSHIASIAPIFQKWAVKNEFHFATSIWAGCQLIINMKRVEKKDLSQWRECHTQLQNDRIKFINSSTPSIVLLGGRLPLIVEEDRFNNGEGGYEGAMDQILQDENNSLLTISDRQDAIKENYKLTVQKIIDAGHTVILLYPIPEVGIHVPKTLLKKIDGKFFSARDISIKNPVTTSFKIFEKRTEKSTQILDDINSEKVFRIIPSAILCNQTMIGRCMTHNSEVSFYRDDDHLSEFGADLILREFEKLISSEDFNYQN